MGHPACLEKDFVNNLKSSTEIALGGSYLCFSLGLNLPLTDFIEDELTRDPGPVKGLYSSNTSPALFRHPSLGPTLVPTLNLALTPASAAINELFKKFMKTYLELNQGPKQLSAERKQPLKVKIPEEYYVKLHMDCYHFCE